MLAVDGEMTVKREKGRAGIILHHADEAGIGEGHGNAMIFFHEIENLEMKSTH